MKILGIGVDIVNNKRIRSLISNKLFINKTFGKKEIGYLNLSKIQSIIDSKKIKSSEKIDLVLLKKLNIIKKKYKKFKGYPLFDPEYARFDTINATVKELNEIRKLNKKIYNKFNSLYNKYDLEKSHMFGATITKVMNATRYKYFLLFI